MAAEYYGVPSWWLPYVQAFYTKARRIGEDLNVAVTSFHRRPAKNASVGGAAASQHLIATAWDVAGPDQDIYAERARAAGLVVIDEGDHIHVQLFRAGVVPSAVYDAVVRA